MGVPRGDTKIYKGDTLIVYAREKTLSNLDKRRKGGIGDISHEEQVKEQKSHMKKQDQEEKQYERDREKQEGG